MSITPGQRLSFLEQDHFKYDDCVVLDTVIRGNERLYEIMKEKEAIYALIIKKFPPKLKYCI